MHSRNTVLTERQLPSYVFLLYIYFFYLISLFRRLRFLRTLWEILDTTQKPPCAFVDLHIY